MVKFTGFQQLLYRKFLLDKYWNVEEMATRLGVSRSTLYSWIDGESTFPVDKVPVLFVLTQDVDFLQFCVEGTGYTLAPLPDAGQVGRVQDEAFDVMAAVGKLAETVRDASADGILTPAEQRRISDLIRTVQRETEELRMAAAQLSRARTAKVHNIREGRS